MAIPASYTARRDRATAGMLADTSLYNIDGACAAKGSIPVGVAVVVESVDSYGHKVVKLPVADTVAYGVAYKSHAYCPTGTYGDADEIDVLSHGRIWMITDDATPPAFGHYVKVAVGTGHAAAAGAISTEWTYTGETFTTKAGVKLVKVQVLQSSSPVV